MPLYGPLWPLKRGNHDTYELILNRKQQINYYLKSLLLTSPGENISDPRYGVGLRSFLFEMNNVFTHDEIISTIRQQISVYLPSIELVDVVINATGQDIDENSLTIKIIYRIGEELEEFDIDLNPTKEIGFY
jgi:phage baseplate assembly protein W